jgi:hypothetical protein
MTETKDITLGSTELIEEIRELSDEDFIELKGLMEMLLNQELNRRFGTYERPEPRMSNNY